MPFKNEYLSFLFVEDEPNVLQLLSRLFSDAYKNATIYLAKENGEAFELALKHRPSLISTDIMHPGGDGYQFLDMLRSNSQTRQIPVILLATVYKDCIKPSTQFFMCSRIGL